MSRPQKISDEQKIQIGLATIEFGRRIMVKDSKILASKLKMKSSDTLSMISGSACQFLYAERYKGLKVTEGYYNFFSNLKDD